MVAKPISLVTFSALAAAVIHHVSAASLESNPVTVVEEITPLNQNHPALGRNIPPTSKAYNLIVNDDIKVNHSVLRSNHRMRKLEATNADIERLESYFGSKMERNINVLQEKYASAEFTPAPWPGSYWPTYGDGINYRWNPDDISAPAKYAQAFGLDEKTLMDSISKNNGILSMADSPECSTQADCDNLGDGSNCGIRDGEQKGRCIPGWYGICHAWAPAAILEPEPRCPVTKNGVTFQPVDIKALISEVYDGSNLGTVFTGARFDGPDNPPVMDSYGRYVDPARRDIGPGFFHIAFSNILGKYKQSFILDVEAGMEVWNQPIRSYEVVEMSLVDPKAASQDAYGTSTYPFNTDMKKLAYVRTRLSWIEEGSENEPVDSNQYTTTVEYRYFLELDDDENIIGGEWLGDSNQNHPDFLWFAASKPAADTVIGVGIKYKDVSELLEESASCGGTLAPTPSPSLTDAPTDTPTNAPTDTPTNAPTDTPTNAPTNAPTDTPTNAPTDTPTNAPSSVPTSAPSFTPTTVPASSVPSTSGPISIPPKQNQNGKHELC